MATASPLRSLNTDAVRRNLARGGAWGAMGVLVSRVLILAMLITVARLVGQDEFGELCMIQQSVVLFSVVISYGLGLTASKHVAEVRDSDPGRMKIVIQAVCLGSLALGILCAALLTAVSGAVAERFYDRPEMAFSLMLSGPWLVASCVSLTIQACLSGTFDFRSVATTQLLEALASILFVVAGVLAYGIDGAVVGFGLAAGASACCGWMLLHSRLQVLGAAHFHPTWTQLQDASGELFRYCLPATLAGLCVGIANWCGPFILVRQSGGFEQLAVFNAANYWFNALMMLPNVVQRVGTVLQAAAAGQQDRATGRTVYRDSLRLNLALMLATAVPLALLSPWILLSFGEEFQQGWPTMIVCLATAIVLAAVKPAEQTLNALGYVGSSLALHALFAIVCIAGVHAVSDYGAFGLAAGRLGAYALHASLMVTVASRIHSTSASTPDRDISLRRAA